MPLSLLVLAAVSVPGRRLLGAVTSGVSRAVADAVLRVAWSFVARRALRACVADVAAMASAAAVVGNGARATSCFV